MDHHGGWIDRIGKDCYGRIQWRRWGHTYDRSMQLQKAYDAITDEEQRQEGLDASNWETFRQVLAICIGDEAHQATMIEKQIEVALDRINRGGSSKSSGSPPGVGAELLAAHKQEINGIAKVDRSPGSYILELVRAMEGQRLRRLST
jgi:hypothetical protein